MFHVWTGLIVGTLFCVMSLSGSVLVLRPWIEDLLRPAWAAKSAERPSQILTAASQNIEHMWPGSKIGSVTFPAQAGALPEFGIRTADNTQLRVFVHPLSGEVLGTFSLRWLEWLTDLHHHLLVEGIGKRIVGFIGIFLFLSSMTGLLVWMRRANPWRLIRGRSLTSFDLHRSVGVVGNVLLLFVAATGVTIAFPQTVAFLLGGRPAAARQQQRGHAESPLPGVALDEYFAAAKQAVPGGAVRQLRLSSAPGRPVTARVSTAGDLRQEGSTRITFETGTAHVRTVDRPEDGAFSQRIVLAATPLHYAEWGGFPLRFVWCLIGLLPPVLFASGVMMWWSPVAARRKAADIVKARGLAANDRETEENLVA